MCKENHHICLRIFPKLFRWSDFCHEGPCNIPEILMKMSTNVPNIKEC